MVYQNRRQKSSYTSISVSAIIFIALLVLTTGIVSAAPASDHLEACSVKVFNSFIVPFEFDDIGAESDAILEAELEAARCAVEELEQEFDHLLDLITPQESTFEVAQGLDQDLRLGEELSNAREVVASFVVRQSSVERLTQQIASQEARDASLVSELALDFAQSLDQDFRLGEELSNAREVVASFVVRQSSVERLTQQIASQEARDASLVSELALDFAQGLDQDFRLGEELSNAREVVASFVVRQSSVERLTQQIASQEARDASLVSELNLDFAQGLDQDQRLGEELSSARMVVASFSARLTSEERTSRQIAVQESRDASLVSELNLDFDLGSDQDSRLGAELSASREAVVSLNTR